MLHECINIIGYVCSVWQDRVRLDAQTKGRSLSESLLKVVTVFASPFLPWALWFAQLVAFWLDSTWLDIMTDQQQEKIFNLQLIVQKLEEELKLYRNGTTTEFVTEIIKEKEAEIVTLNGTIEETNEKLRKLAKSSQEVITRCESLSFDIIW